jgi:hypothetical protein
MRRILSAVAILLALPWTAQTAHATPSSTFWTPMTLDMQPYGLLHVGVDNYFTAGRKLDDGAGAFPTDLGLTIGVLPGTKLQAEVGVDYLEPTDHPWVFNFKVGAPEKTLSSQSPALQVGMFGLGTGPGTNENVLYAIVGKSLPPVGRLSVSPYTGNGSVLKDARGNESKSGIMVAYDHGLIAAKDFNRLVIAADYASGNNVIGGGGVGLYYYFSSTISLVGGPVWFNEKQLNGENKWSLQLDINQPKLFGH